MPQLTRIDAIIAETVRLEGDKYTNISGDKGGPTRNGVTLKYIRGIGLQGGDLNKDGVVDHLDVQLVTPDIAAVFFKEDFYYHPKINLLPEPLQAPVFDHAVNSGPAQAIITLQKVLRKLVRWMPADGVLGQKTAAMAKEAIEKYTTKTVVNALVDGRKAFYTALAAEDHSQEKFLKGWHNRAESFRMK